MTTTTRLQNIVTTFTEALRRIELWMNDRHGKPVMPESVAMGIQVAHLLIREGDVPQQCQDLAVASGRLYEELKAYSEHKAKSALPNGAPTSRFWSAAREVKACLETAKPIQMEVLESVQELRLQGVSPEQIARQIYSRNGVGPFLSENGGVNYGLIEREAKEPGSVLGQNWVPPWHEDAIKKHREQVAHKLEAYETLADPKRMEDPATVEEMIREGAYVQQIERTKGVTRDDVLKEAERIGVEVFDQPGFHLARESTVATKPEPKTSIESGKDTAGTNGEPETGSRRAPEMTADQEAAAKEATIKLWEENEQLGAAELANQLRDKGFPVNTARCAAWITHHKRNRTAANA